MRGRFHDHLLNLLGVKVTVMNFVVQLKDVVFQEVFGHDAQVVESHSELSRIERPSALPLLVEVHGAEAPLYERDVVFLKFKEYDELI